MYSWLDPEDFGKLHLPEYRKAKNLAISGEVVATSALPAPQGDQAALFRELTQAVVQLNGRMEALESSPLLGLPGGVVVRALRSTNAQQNALSFDD